METCLKPQLSYSVSYDNISAVPVIIVAAGASNRMGGINKQTMVICDMPVIARTLSAFQKSPYISKIILVTREEDIFLMQGICNKYGINKISDIVSGGSNRHASVLCGMERLDISDKTVLIHDGARPFVNDDMIYDAISALSQYDGSLCAIKVNDTVKSAAEDVTVEKTIDRASLYLAQTPQGVWVEKYKKASEALGDFTDDASVLEAAGYRVKIVNGDKRNIKITTPDDIPLAEAMIKGGLV